MTIPSDVNRSGPYTGDGVATAFDYKFKVYDERDVSVVVTDNVGSDSKLVLNTDYTVTGVGVDGGGQVVLSAPLTAGYQLTTLLDVSFTQEIDLENQGAYYAETVERALDLGVMRDQQLEERLNRAVTIPPSADLAALDVLIANILRLGQSADMLDIVAAIRDQIVTTAEVSAEVVTVAGIANQVRTVAGIAANVTTVAAMQANVAALVADKASIDTVAAGIASVKSVAADLTHIDAVAADLTNIDAVAANKANIDTVAGNSANVTKVAGVADSVPTVAGISSQVQTVATNMATVKNFGDVYQGAFAAAPTKRRDNTALQRGDMYFDTALDTLRFYGSTGWEEGYFDGSLYYTKSDIDEQLGTMGRRDVFVSAAAPTADVGVDGDIYLQF